MTNAALLTTEENKLLKEMQRHSTENQHYYIISELTQTKNNRHFSGQFFLATVLPAIQKICALLSDYEKIKDGYLNKLNTFETEINKVKESTHVYSSEITERLENNFDHLDLTLQARIADFEPHVSLLRFQLGQLLILSGRHLFAHTALEKLLKNDALHNSHLINRRYLLDGLIAQKERLPQEEDAAEKHAELTNLIHDERIRQKRELARSLPLLDQISVAIQEVSTTTVYRPFLTLLSNFVQQESRLSDPQLRVQLLEMNLSSTAKTATPAERLTQIIAIWDKISHSKNIFSRRHKSFSEIDQLLLRLKESQDTKSRQALWKDIANKCRACLDAAYKRSAPLKTAQLNAFAHMLSMAQHEMHHLTLISSQKSSRSENLKPLLKHSIFTKRTSTRRIGLPEMSIPSALEKCLNEWQEILHSEASILSTQALNKAVKNAQNLLKLGKEYRPQNSSEDCIVELGKACHQWLFQNAVKLDKTPVYLAVDQLSDAVITTICSTTDIGEKERKRLLNEIREMPLMVEETLAAPSTTPPTPHA